MFMKRTFEEALKNRRSYYAIGSDSKLPASEIIEVVRTAVKHVPSAFNSQSTRVVVLFDDEHTKLWNIVKDVLRKIVPANAFAGTEAKINNCFAAGYGTVLFFEDQTVVETLQSNFPLYSDNFPGWSLQTSAMHQLAVWTMLEDLGLGASLQHYNPLIDDDVRAAWNIPDTWKLIAQMPFGNPKETPAAKEFSDLDERIKVFL